MGWSVRADESGPVNCKQYGQVLYGYIMDKLVIRPLQKSAIYRHHRVGPLAGHTCCQCDGMLLCDTHVKVAIGKTLLKLNQPGTLTHGRGNRQQTLILLSHIA